MDEHGISIVMAVYNVEKYLNIMLESIFNQTFKDFELIIINDGSSDNTGDIIAKYMKKYDNIFYLKQENKGVSEARNLGINDISKKYTIFFDGDDYIDKDMLQKMYFNAEKNKADIVICGYEKIYETKEKIRKRENNIFCAEENKVYTNAEVMELFMDFKVDGYLWNKMFLSKNILKYNMKFEKDRIIEDLFPAFKQVSISKKIVFINKPLYKYRQRDTSILHLNSELRIINDQHHAYYMMANLSKSIKGINKRKYYEFVAFVQATHIGKCVELNIKCNKDIYLKYQIDNLKCIQILLDVKKAIKVKIKLLLYKFNILHYIYKVRKQYIFSCFRHMKID